MPDSTSDPLIGTTLDERYRLDRQIATGGMGVVYLAEHLFVGNQVAVKLLTGAAAQDASLKERFLHEPRLAAAIEHPNIIQVLDAGVDDGKPYLVMDYVDGGDLGRLLESVGRLAPPRALRILQQAAAGLDAAHSRGVIHRDIKPGNILVTPQDHVYLTDFGIARRASVDRASTDMNVFMGTPDYAAPEQMQGGELDQRADVYSFGCVLFHCLAGDPPFSDRSQQELLRAHTEEPPPRLTARCPELARPIDDVISQAMAKDRARRFLSCGALIRAARTALQSRPAQFCPRCGSQPRPGNRFCTACGLELEAR
jgi:serine/threonine-protein kinase